VHQEEPLQVLPTPFNVDNSGASKATEEQWASDDQGDFHYVGDQWTTSSKIDRSHTRVSSFTGSSPYKSEWGGIVKDTPPQMATGTWNTWNTWNTLITCYMCMFDV
jgi:hypothetical protein